MSAVLALSIDDLNAGASRQRGIPQYPSRHSTNALHRNAPVVVSLPETKRESNTMSLARFPERLGDRVSAALWRRINAGAINRKHLQHALGVSSGTIDNLLSGNSDPSGRVLMGLLTFFDSAFANEILAPTGCTVAKLSDARAAALRKVAEGMAELQRMEGA